MSVQSVLGLKDLNNTTGSLLSKKSTATKHMLVDEMVFDNLVEDIPMLSNSIKKGSELLSTFKDMSFDIFMNMYKKNPELHEKQEMLGSRHFNYDTMTELRNMKEFHETRAKCSHDLLKSSIGTEIYNANVIEKVVKIIEEHNKAKEETPENGDSGNAIDKINNLDKAEKEAIQKAIESLQKPQNGDISGDKQGNSDNNTQPTDGQGVANKFGNEAGQNNNSGGTKLTEELSRQLADKQAELEQNNDVNKLANDIKQAVKDSIKETNDTVSEISDFIDSWGLSGDDSEVRITFEECRDALEKIRRSPNLKDLTDIVGNFKNIARRTILRASKGKGIAIKGINVGNDISKTLTSEKILLSKSNTKPLFYKKYSEKQLLQYETESKKRMGLGPMIVCLDISSSMRGDRIKWGKAVALALLEISQKQKRDYAIVPFNTSVVDPIIIPKKTLKPDKILQIGEIGTSGGTNFNKPINKALDIIDNHKEFKKADIVFITDGACNISSMVEEKLQKIRSKKDLLIQGILINVGSSVSNKGLEWTDSIKRVSDMADLNEKLAEDIFYYSALNSKDGGN